MYFVICYCLIVNKVNVFFLLERGKVMLQLLEVIARKSRHLQFPAVLMFSQTKLQYVNTVYSSRKCPYLPPWKGFFYQTPPLPHWKFLLSFMHFSLGNSNPFCVGNLHNVGLHQCHPFLCTLKITFHIECKVVNIYICLINKFCYCTGDSTHQINSSSVSIKGLWTDHGLKKF